MKRSYLPYFVALMALAAAWACQRPQAPYESAAFGTIDSRGWVYGDTMVMNPSTALDSCPGTARLAVVVRHADNYEYGNLWLELTSPAVTASPTDSLTADSMCIDTINVVLCDATGRWLGSGTGPSRVFTDTLPARYGYDCLHPVTIRHIMRVDTVKGIEQIGLVYFDYDSIQHAQTY